MVVSQAKVFMIIQNKILLLISSVLIISAISCKKDKVQQDTIPNVSVDFQINLNNPDYQNLSLDGGFAYVNGGYNGIMIYRENSKTYKAIERAFTYQPSSDCAIITMDISQLFIVDTCCKSQFDFNGNVISGVAPFNLKLYQTSLSDNYLRVTN